MMFVLHIRSFGSGCLTREYRVRREWFNLKEKMFRTGG
jgi:hypothetical protein